jgi:hypothetical protein
MKDEVRHDRDEDREAEDVDERDAEDRENAGDHSPRFLALSG